MPRNFHRRIIALGTVFDYSKFLTANFPLADRWDHQDLSGSSVLEASYTTALATGRSVALITYGDYVAGANWANSSGQIARHSAGSVETFQQDDILAAGKTYQVTITLANRTAGSVTITDGGAAISANEQTTRTITSTGTDFIITPTSDFDGDIDVAIILVQQTGILASSAYAPGTNPMDGTTTVAQVGVPSNFGSLGLSVVDDGAASFSDFHSAEVNSKFNPAAGFVNIWAKVANAGVWADGITRDLVLLLVDGSNFRQIRKTAAANELRTVSANGGTNNEIIHTVSTTDYFMVTIVWGDNKHISYINGVQDGATATPLGTWVGNLLSTQTLIGARNTTPTLVWDGSRTRFMLGYEAITPAQVLSLYNQGRR